MFLDIIIPIYNTKEEYLRNALESINRQKNLSFNDVGVIVIDNASDKIKYEELWFKNNFPKLNIKFIINEKNIGPGASRQRAINMSNATYITLLDSDDEFYGDNSLAPIMMGLSKNTNINVLYTLMRQEYKKDGEIKYFDLSFNQYQSLHGLFFKRKYLIENEIGFHDKLTRYDDTYFMGCLTSGHKGVFVKNLTYVWKYIEGSETANESKYNYSVIHFEQMVNCYLYIYEYYKKHNKEKAPLYIVQQIIECILFLESSFFNYEELKDKKELYENRLYDLYIKYKKEFEKFDETFINKINDYKKKEIIYLSGKVDFLGDFYTFLEKKSKKVS